MDWFLYDNGLRHESVKYYSNEYNKKLVKNLLMGKF